MSQLFTDGKIITDVKLQWSERSKRHYAYFTMVEKLGYGDRARDQYIQVWAFGSDAQQLVSRKAGKHDRVWVNGTVELADFLRGGTTKDRGLKLYLAQWGFASDGVPKMTLEMQPAAAGAEPVGTATKAAPIEVIRGDKDTLPE